MNERQYKRFDSILSLNHFFNTNNAQINTALAPLVPVIAEFTTLYNAMMDAAVASGAADRRNAAAEIKDSLKLQCKDIVWKLTVAMQYHFAMVGDEIAANKVKLSKSKIQIMAENQFYAYSQLLMNLYEPGVYVPYGIPDADIDVLKQKLLDFPNQMQLTHDGRIKRKLAAIKLDKTIRSIHELLNQRMNKLIDLLQTSHFNLYQNYYNARHLKLPAATKGSPHKQGTLMPGEVVMLDRHAFRRKKAIIVRNTGVAILQAGIGHTSTAMGGTPFTIAPGQTSQRISQKLAPNGEFILLKNIGEQQTGYKVWMKE